MKRQILFLCTGNYYRSRYAEVLFNSRARKVGLAWRAFSRGLAEKGSPENVGPISPIALQALLARNIELEGHDRLPISCSAADFEMADLIIALKDDEHRPMVGRRFPEIRSRVEYWEVDDVAVAEPATALALIDERVDGLLAQLRSS
ncbi:arsenate-mycothiol transferase ArsC [Bradyrhizobium archetypum]|uniref:Low molecular weight phosphatase family protein n=1 Tax=Bradyrhizobium archetypum TaxID=2721160 RepID=A0A7Y4H5R1_9BRAD|nr:low molecular weight phosphatase family protein [Bradyrhizobium archetypum]NOJ47839.1 low molecular weight phosphatase family protein [Bradyrhizobium archetypum]